MFTKKNYIAFLKLIRNFTYSHKDDNAYWRTGTVDLWTREIDQQRDIISRYANIPKNKIQVNN